MLPKLNLQFFFYKIKIKNLFLKTTKICLSLKIFFKITYQIPTLIFG